ncbi:methyl-accepting chemotaxis protein, partial [Pseudomonas syringae]
MKNWNLRPRILASFAVLSASMPLMVAVPYSRLLSIELSEDDGRLYASPGVHYSTLGRSACG